MIEIKQASRGGSSTTAARSLPLALRRGFGQTCPACGKGSLYRAFLKVSECCPACGEVFSHHRADDAPPYFTILIVGHIVIGGVLALEQAYAPDAWVHLALWVPLTVVLSLLLLPRVKGALVGLQWALRMHGFGSGPDPAAVVTEPGHEMFGAARDDGR